MAVVIQEMVPAENAGVIFSRDPATGNPAKIVITANYGLGEVNDKKTKPLIAGKSQRKCCET